MHAETQLPSYQDFPFRALWPGELVYARQTHLCSTGQDMIRRLVGREAPATPPVPTKIDRQWHRPADSLILDRAQYNKTDR
jgi:hypothetical protein